MSESAFPQIETVVYQDGEKLDTPRIQSFGGMELRDWFAGQALAGWLASFGEEQAHPIAADTATSVAEYSYALADAMMAARSKGRDQDSHG